MTSSGGRLRTNSIGISPLPGSPPAAYGSIIIPCVCHRHHQEQLGFRCISFIARFQSEGLGAPTSTARLFIVNTSNVSDEMCIQLFRFIEDFLSPLRSTVMNFSPIRTGRGHFYRGKSICLQIIYRKGGFLSVFCCFG